MLIEPSVLISESSVGHPFVGVEIGVQRNALNIYVITGYNSSYLPRDFKSLIVIP